MSIVLLEVGSMSRAELRTELAAAGVGLNDSAETLLAGPAFDRPDPSRIEVVECSVGDLGLDTGASLSRILATARDRGLLPCSPVTGPYLRLALTDQPTAPDSVMSSGRVPTGSVTVASEPLAPDDADHPRGFYLRVVDGRPWLRGFHCTDEHPWHAADRFAFCRAAT